MSRNFKNWCLLTIRNGEIQNKSQVKKLFAELKDGRYTLEVEKADKRSNEQNRYYFGIVVPVLQNAFKDYGHQLTKEETHDFLKGKFNYLEIVNDEIGEFITIPKTTTGLNKEQFSEYIEKIQIWAAQFLNIVIPDPGQQMEIEA